MYVPNAFSVCSCVRVFVPVGVCALLCLRFFCCVGVSLCVRVSVCVYLFVLCPGPVLSPPFSFPCSFLSVLSRKSILFRADPSKEKKLAVE